jgi:predicted nucleic acid-binding Zn finger protein
MWNPSTQKSNLKELEMKVYAMSPMFPPALGRDGKPVVVDVNSSSGSRTYRVDLTYGRCSCPAWIYQKGGVRKPCKHLRALGFVEVNDMVEVKTNEPVEIGMAKIEKELRQAVVEHEM